MPSEMKWGISIAVGLGLVTVGWKWAPWLLTMVHVFVSFLLVLVVLLQSGKAADLAGAFGGSGSQTAFGPRGAATFLSKATTWCAIMFMITSTVLGLRPLTSGSTGSSVLEQFSKPAPKQSAPANPAPPPQPPAQQPQQQAPAAPAPAPQPPASKP